jgi:hypothetical protein
MRLDYKVAVAWAAGFFEGEGSVAIRSLGVNQVNREPLERLKKLFGGQVNLGYPAKGNRKACYAWWICGEEARMFVEAIWPFLSIRRQRQIDNKFITAEKRIRHRESIRTACVERTKLRVRDRNGRLVSNA